ncbi:MAG: hypothetical protein ACKO9D_13825, partial [Gammaproteobacteria bacterium]
PPTAPGEPAWVVGEAGRTREGARVRCYLRIARSVITAAEFRVFGCPHTRAVAKALAVALPGRPLGPAVPDPAAANPSLGTPRDWAARHGVPPEKLGRLLVVEDAWLRACEAALARSAVDGR